MRRWCVAAFAARDFYAIPLALHEAGLLDRLFTDFYSPDLLARAIPRFRKRYRDGLPSGKVKNYILRVEALRFLWRMRGADGLECERLGDDMLGRVAARYAAKKGSGVVAYNYHWLGVARQAALMSGVDRKILVQIHPVATQVREILARDRAATGMPFAKEAEEKLSAAQIKEYIDSLESADLIVAPSYFVRKGLESIGAAPERISVIPLASVIPPVSDPYESFSGSDPKLRLLFVGQLVQRKGLHHLLSALKKFPASAFSLTIVCSKPPDPELAKMLPDHVDFRPGVSLSELTALYRTSDLFVMPSLLEGFGFVYSEALSQGLPIICTENTGGADLITDGVEGFVVRAGETEPLAAVLERCLHDLQSVRAMRPKALRRASAWTWTDFCHQIRTAIVSKSADRD